MFFLLPPSLVSVAQFSFFLQPYQIQLVLVNLRKKELLSPIRHKSTTVSDTVGSHYPDPAKQEHVLYVFSNPSSPPDTNSPNVHAKYPGIVKNIVFTFFSPCF